METPRALVQGALSGQSTTLTSSVSAPVNVRSERGVEKLDESGDSSNSLDSSTSNSMEPEISHPILGLKCTRP